jgi:preprotein translocase subunit SecB
MNASPLQLERHFFTKVQIDANPVGKVGDPNQLNCEVEVGTAEGDPKRFQLTMRLRLLSAAGDQACYTGEVHAVGLFRVVDSWPTEKVLTLVQANGSALLYGAIRELLLSITARGPWPPVLLMSVTFIQSKTNPKIIAGCESPSKPVKP